MRRTIKALQTDSDVGYFPEILTLGDFEYDAVTDAEALSEWDALGLIDHVVTEGENGDMIQLWRFGEGNYFIVPVPEGYSVRQALSKRMEVTAQHVFYVRFHDLDNLTYEIARIQRRIDAIKALTFAQFRTK